MERLRQAQSKEAHREKLAAKARGVGHTRAPTREVHQSLTDCIACALRSCSTHAWPA